MKKITQICLLVLLSVCSLQSVSVKAFGNPQPIGLVHFSYLVGIEEPIIYYPFGMGDSGIPASAVVYDDRTIVITFSRPVGSADAELQKDDMVVGISHKPSGSDTMTLRLPLSPGDYTIYLYLQDGTTLVGEYTQE